LEKLAQWDGQFMTGIVTPVVQFAQQHLAWLGGAYSVAYGLVNGMAINVRYLACVFVAYFLIEQLLPLSRNSLRSYGRAVCFWAITVSLNAFIFALVYQVLDKDKLSAWWVVDLSLPTYSPPVQLLGMIAATLAGLIIGNLLYYWFHRAQHAVPFLWRFHKVHHSITELSALNSYHHVTEDALQYVLTVAPMLLLIQFNSGAMPWIVAAILGTQAFYVHSSANINIGPLRYLIGDNRFHRIHHSNQERHFGKNFGTTTPIWDLLFRTAYFPQPGEWPETGLADTLEPKNVRDFLTMPFNK
jgi:sterol desaturase/sphingolipid hydroxylase (fatty acid hydroxylase superfamily)